MKMIVKVDSCDVVSCTARSHCAEVHINIGGMAHSLERGLMPMRLHFERAESDQANVEELDIPMGNA